ncbi:hypothetical protein OF122_12870 [Pelagibacterium flavum]|uniref:Uncharacterized protein n=1 Tax=Pelagibacterium flavum TaxID=2984530 RepID=A0ABY6INW4_9HYPH|nr:hypothetical protein [Pelagibacterium sp. YIM 151497]UYQ70950.1 hypothetical protein OF122_12870 [Pelagibacterium sp. YIM 151497]
MNDDDFAQEVQDAKEALAETIGMPFDEFMALDPSEQTELCLRQGLAFACSPNVAPLGKDGKPVTNFEGGEKSPLN